MSDDFLGAAAGTAPPATTDPPNRLGKRSRNRYDFLLRSPLYEPENLDLHLGPEALALVTGALDRLEGKQVIDYHCHIAGIGNGTACCGPPGVLPSCKRHSRGFGLGEAVNRAKSRVFMSAFGVMEDQQDVEAAERIARLVKEVPADLKCVLLAFDWRHDRESGEALPDETPLYVPNEYTHSLAQSEPSSFLAACSVHPYRKDAVEELERCRARGTRLCKWLPNSMRFDPADERCDAFYDACARLGVAILCHTGDETSVHFAGASVDNSLGNPLRLRRALRRGVRVIAAHCASEGSAPDDDGRQVSCWQLLLRMMDEPEWKELLFADISALIIFRRVPVLLQAPRPRRTLLAAAPAVEPGALACARRCSSTPRSSRASSSAPTTRSPRSAAASSARGRSRSRCCTAAPSGRSSSPPAC